MSTWVEREARRISKAIMLLRPGIPTAGGIWADIGCGDGIFTSALYTLIQPGGEIYAVDQGQFALDSLVRHLAESYPPALAACRRDSLSPNSICGKIAAN